MIDEPPFGKSILKERAEGAPVSALERAVAWYARPGVKVAVDNFTATVFAGLIGAAASRAAGPSVLEATVAGWSAFNVSHPVLYLGIAAGANRALAHSGHETVSVARELTEGYVSGGFLFGFYNAMVVPMQISLNKRGVDPAQTVFWSNVLTTAAITPIRGLVYYGMDWIVGHARQIYLWTSARARGLLEHEEDPEADA